MICSSTAGSVRPKNEFKFKNAVIDHLEPCVKEADVMRGQLVVGILKCGGGSKSSPLKIESKRQGSLTLMWLW